MNEPPSVVDRSDDSATNAETKPGAVVAAASLNRVAQNEKNKKMNEPPSVLDRSDDSSTTAETKPGAVAAASSDRVAQNEKNKERRAKRHSSKPSPSEALPVTPKAHVAASAAAVLPLASVEEKEDGPAPGAVAVLGTTSTGTAAVKGLSGLALAEGVDGCEDNAMRANTGSEDTVAGKTNAKKGSRLSLAEGVHPPGIGAMPGGRGLSISDGGADQSKHSETTTQKGPNDGPETPFEVEAMLVEEGQGEQQQQQMVDRDKIEQEIRNELLNKTVVGEAIIVDDTSNNLTSGKRRWAILFCVILVLIGVVVAIVIAGTGGEKEIKKEEEEEVNVSVPTASPTPATTTSPQPTWSPTDAIEDLDNGLREMAHPLVLRGTTLENTGENFQFQSFGGTSAACDLRRQRNLATWRDETEGLWYKYRSRSLGPVTVVLCGTALYELQLFSQGFHVVCSTIHNGDLGSCGGSSVSWIAQEGLTYTILVRRSYSAIPVNEAFTISIVDNDDCQYAFGPIAPTSAGVVMSYSTRNAKIDTEVSGSCGGASAGGGPGVWYLVEGTGRPITASTCSVDSSSTPSFDTQISVHGGGHCDNLSCLNGNNGFCGQGSSVTWPSQMGEIYHILVQGSNSGVVGDFELTLSTDADRKENDFCATAAEFVVGEVEFTFSGSTADDVPVCNDQDPTDDSVESLPYGLWYKRVGTGDNFCFLVYEPDEAPVFMKVLTGSCGDLVCVPDKEAIGWAVVGYSNNGYCFPTVLGQTYYVFLATRDRLNIDVLHRIEVCLYGGDDYDNSFLCPVE